MSKDESSVVVQDELQLVKDFLRDSVGYYIREKFTGIDAGIENREINRDLEKTLSSLLDGMAKPAQFFDKDGKPLDGVPMRERQAEIEKAAEALKKDLPKYIEFLDLDILKPAKQLMTQDDAPENLVTKMQEVASNSVVAKTSQTIEKILSSSRSENKKQTLKVVLSKAATFFKKIKIPGLASIVQYTRDSYLTKKREDRYNSSPAEALRKALKTTVSSIGVNSSSFAIGDNAPQKTAGISR